MAIKKNTRKNVSRVINVIMALVLLASIIAIPVIAFITLF